MIDADGYRPNVGIVLLNGDGRLFWARQGRVNWGGTPTYGYRLSARTESLPRQLVVEESEAAVVRQM